jgi:hypothetical protein
LVRKIVFRAGGRGGESEGWTSRARCRAPPQPESETSEGLRSSDDCTDCGFTSARAIGDAEGCRCNKRDNHSPTSTHFFPEYRKPRPRRLRARWIQQFIHPARLDWFRQPANWYNLLTSDNFRPYGRSRLQLHWRQDPDFVYGNSGECKCCPRGNDGVHGWNDGEHFNPSHSVGQFLQRLLQPNQRQLLRICCIYGYHRCHCIH